MRDPAAWAGLALAPLIVLAGCSAAPDTATPAPGPTSFVPLPREPALDVATPSVSPSASDWVEGRIIPGTNLTTGPTPGTVTGGQAFGVPLRYVPPAPGYKPKCRPATNAEKTALEATFVPMKPGTRVAAVDLPEAGYSVAAADMPGLGFESEGRRAGVIVGGGHFSAVDGEWPGTHTLSRVAFADGPAAYAAAVKCVKR